MKRHRGAAISERGNSDRRKITASEQEKPRKQPRLFFSFPLLLSTSPPLALVHKSRHTKFNILYSFFPSLHVAQLKHYREACNDLHCMGMGLFVHILSLFSTSATQRFHQQTNTITRSGIFRSLHWRTAVHVKMSQSGYRLQAAGGKLISAYLCVIY